MNIHFFKTANLYRGFFRASLFISFIVFLWAMCIKAPKYFPIAFGFTEKDVEEIIKKHGPTIEFWNFKGTPSVEDIKTNPDQFIAWLDCGRGVIPLGYNYSTGMPCGDTSCEITNKAIDRILKWHINWIVPIDYSGGSLVKNKEYRVIAASPSFVSDEDGHTKMFKPHEDGYSIIPTTFGVIKFSIACGILFALPCFIFFGFIFPFLINAFLFSVSFVVRYFIWVKNGFLSSV